MMSHSQNDVSKFITSDQLHNKNCFKYLRALQISDRLLALFPDDLSKLKAQLKDYQPKFAYGDLYTKFVRYLDNKDVIDSLYHKLLPIMAECIESEIIAASKVPISEENKEKIKGLKDEKATLEDQIDALFNSIYANDNNILEDTFNLIKDIPLDKTPFGPEINSGIANRNKDDSTKVNRITPKRQERPDVRLAAVLSSTFKQHTTNLATVRHYQSNADSSVKEYRFATQGQREHGMDQVSPLFKQFLRVQAKNIKQSRAVDSDLPPITHIYFNNLGRDRTDIEGCKEKALTTALESLEGDEHPNVAVITLPADKGLMAHNDFKFTEAKIPYSIVRDDLLKIAGEDPSSTDEIKDFHISTSIRERIFRDENGHDVQSSMLGSLLDKSFIALGLEGAVMLSKAQKQAVWFHFLKFELTNHIIKTLEPQSINFSCKDAIDRGGVSSAYYNLIKSFEPTCSKPMNRLEFEQALHAAPTMVKGRGMNGHLQILWNCVDQYLSKNYDVIRHEPDKAWLIEWRDFNCPHARVNELLKMRLPQIKQNLSEEIGSSVSHNRVIIRGISIINEIITQTNLGMSGKRLLLEVAVRTSTVALSPTLENLKQYSHLSEQISINYPILTLLAGLMKVLIGAIVYVATFGKKSNWVQEGCETYSLGKNALNRKQLQKHMKDQINNIQDLKKKEQLKSYIIMPEVKGRSIDADEEKKKSTKK